MRYVSGPVFCQRCQFGPAPGQPQLAGHALVGDNRMLYVPSEGFVYVASALVLHYIDAHWWLPPEPFVRAVMDCPPMRSVPYFLRLKRAGMRLTPPVR